MLKKAIAANLAAREEHDKRQHEAFEKSGAEPKLEFFSAAELAEADPNLLYLEGIVTDPVRKALRKQLKSLGWRLCGLLGNTRAMVPIAEEIADIEGSYGNRVNMIDKCWDGIGKDKDWWVA
jgi:hypothetical protein